MEYKSFNVDQLEQFIGSSYFENSSVIPISRHRALSHFKNPHVSAGDVIMVMAFNDLGKLVGYVGVLPGRIALGEREEKIGWLSCLWIDETERGKGIARKLVEQALGYWGNKIIATEFTKEAKALYDKTGMFADLHTSWGMRGYLRFNLQKILPPKRNFFRKISRILKAADAVLNIVNDMRLSRWKPERDSASLRLEYTSIIDEETAAFIKRLNSTELFKRSSKDLAWIISHPWVLSAPFPDSLSQKYHFSSLAGSFQFICLKIFDINHNLIGFIMLSERDKSMKVPYIYSEKGCIKQVSDVILNAMVKMKINDITIFHPELTAYWNKEKTPFIQQRKMKRQYIHSRLFDVTPTNLLIQDGDGDCAFT